MTEPVEKRTENRLARLRDRFSGHGIDSLLISRPADVRYLTGFTGGEGQLAVFSDEALLFVDFRYTEQAEKEAPGVTVTEYRGRIEEPFADMTKRLGHLGFDSTFLTYRTFHEIREKTGLALTPCREPVSPLRAVKDAEEITMIKNSAEVAEKAFAGIRQNIRPGLTEKDVSDEIEYQMRKLGADAGSFPAIIASGINASAPHHTVSNRVIEAGDCVLIDWGASVSGYASDTTRILFLGEPTDEHRTVYAAVLEAQRRGLEALRDGRTGVEVDGAARTHLTDLGYGKCFGHGLGHGVGLEVHEPPRLSPRSEDVLEEGMVVTVEPAVYKRNWGGIRIEDLAVVTKDGHELLTSLPKDIDSAIAAG